MPLYEAWTPVGRMVQGDVLTANTKNKAGAQLMTRDGKPRSNAFMAIAYPKTQAAWWLEPDPMWAALYNAGRAAFPQHFDAQGLCKLPRFAWKIMDGDGVDDDGKPNNMKEGFAGHWVLKLSSSYVPKLLHAGQYIVDPKVPKRGWFYRAFISVESNAGASDKPGLFINHNGVELMASGPEIVSGPDLVSAAAAAPVVALPAGAIALPAGFGAGSMAPPPQMGGAPAMAPPGGMHPPPGMGAVPQAAPPGLTPPQMPAPVMAPAGVPVLPGVPTAAPANMAFVNNAGAPPLPGAAPALALPVAAAPQYGPGPASQGQPPAVWLASYTPEQCIAAGVIVKLN